MRINTHISADAMNMFLLAVLLAVTVRNSLVVFSALHVPLKVQDYTRGVL
jgi:hypothetical protein